MNFGRQLKRVKQQADHLFLRSDRTDVVGELRAAEDQAEELRVLCEAFSRCLEKCLYTLNCPDEKKLRKVPVYLAAETLRDGILPGPQDDTDHQDLLRMVAVRTVEMQQAMGMDVVEYEEKVEQKVLLPLSHLIKEDFPSIAKQKKLLKQVGLDLDAAKTRLRNAQAAPAPNPKQDTYREELEEAEGKLDQTRDSYACDIFSLLAREREVSTYMCAFLEMQREFLQQSLHRLDRILPNLHQHLKASTTSPMYGLPLHEHLHITQQEVAVPLQVCVRHLVEVGLYEEGLFRVAGSTSKVRRLKGAFDAGLVTLETLSGAEEHDRDYDVHVIAGALKCYLRELPEPLLTYLLHQQWLEAVRLPDHQQRMKALWQVVKQLPPANLANLRYLVKFLAQLAARSSSNKMCPSNIAIVIAPNLIWAQPEAGEEEPDLSTLGRSMSLTADYRAIVDHLVEYSDYFFKEDIDFGVMPRVPPSPARQSNEANGALPASGQQPRAAFQTHRRNLSTETGGGPATADACESPKQPQRTKKKQAPRPPQQRPHSTYDSHEQALASNSASASPEQARSSSPPNSAPPVSSQAHFSSLIPSAPTPAPTLAPTPVPTPVPITASAPAPAARLHHSNSLRRPTAEPPKPPGVPAKPPRPSPPTAEALERSATQLPETKGVGGAPLGFEQMHTCKEVEGVEGTMQGPPEGSVGTIGFVVEGSVEERVERPHPGSQSFRKSLESVIQLQAAGQPMALPRHGPVAAEVEGTPHPAPMAEAPARPVMPPTPAQRTTIPVTPAIARPDRPEPVRVEKPALPEKPSLPSKPQLLDRPNMLPRPSLTTATPLTTVSAPTTALTAAPAQPSNPGAAATQPDQESSSEEARPGSPTLNNSTAPNNQDRPEGQSGDQAGNPTVSLTTAHPGRGLKGGGTVKFTWPPSHDAADSPVAREEAAPDSTHL